MLSIILIPLLLFIIYKWSTSTFDFFKKQGIPFRKPVPLFGTHFNMISRKKPFIEALSEWYYEFENEKISGLFKFRRPIVFVKDPELIKQLTIRDFDYFMDHRVLMTEDLDPLIGKNLVSLTGQKWKDMRSTLSPAFTGSKMRQMFELVKTVGLQTTDTLKTDLKREHENLLEFKEFASKLTCDNIATCSFGIEVNSLKNPFNEFYKHAQKVLDFSGLLAALKLFGYILFPKVMKRIGIRLLNKEACDFFEGVFYETLKTRERHGIIRNDMINLLLETKKGKLIHNEKAEEKIPDGFASVEESNVGISVVTRKWNDQDLAAQCFIFFLAGFETVAQTMSFMAYELACNPDIQQKLYNEIFNIAKDGIGENVTYEQLKSMKYLDQVVTEVLRKWPATPLTDRLCVKDYELKYDNKKLKLTSRKHSLLISIFSIHRDPKYYPDPEKFDPERFSDENKHLIQDSTYLPFGIGPRNCIGSRFALMEIKTVFFYLLLHFSLEVTEKTQIPLKFENTPYQIKPEKGIWVALKPRKL